MILSLCLRSIRYELFEASFEIAGTLTPRRQSQSSLPSSFGINPARQSEAAAAAAAAAGAPPSVFLPLRFRPCSTRHFEHRARHIVDDPRQVIPEDFSVWSGIVTLRLCLHLPHLILFPLPYFFHFVDPPRSQIDRTDSSERHKLPTPPPLAQCSIRADLGTLTKSFKSKICMFRQPI